MKTWPIFLLSLVLGAGVGYALAYYQVHRAPWDGTANGLGSAAVPVEPGQELPEIVIEPETFDFGTMDASSTRSREFEIKNVGKAKLTLEKGDTTCRCTKFELGATELEPGQSTKATVEWTGKNFRGPYRQHANIQTNDPRKSRVSITITGKIISTTKVEPPDLVFSNIAAGTKATQTLQIYSFAPGKFELSDAEIFPPDNREWFEVKVEPMPEAQVQKEEEAKAGYLVHLTVKPGLPLETFEQTIHLKTNLAKVERIDIPLRGTITRDLAVIGSGWSNAQNLLSFPDVVSSDAGAAMELFVTARGADRRLLKLRPIEVTPDFLEVKVGEAKEVEGKELVRVTVIVKIPKGSPAANYLGGGNPLGKIRFETGLPRSEQLEMRVRFAIQG